MSNPMLAYVGLSRPYRFERAIIAFVALVVVLAVLLTAGWLVAIGELTASWRLHSCAGRGSPAPC
jgi:hypothetical protein